MQEGDSIIYFLSDFRLWDPFLPVKDDPKIYKHSGKEYYLPFESTQTISVIGSWFNHPEDSTIRDVDFTKEEVQRLVRNAIIRAMKKVAGEYLPPLLDALAEHYGLSYKRVKITGSKGRWGSCSAAGSINLSCYLMLLPSHLMDYVLLHELSHTKEMNHGPRFWELLDSMTEGRAHLLRAELRQFNTDF